MDNVPPSSRRDPRYMLRHGIGDIAFTLPEPNGGVTVAPLKLISVSGLAFESDVDTELFEPDMELPNIRIKIGRCVVHGDALVRNTAATDKGKVEVGCLFYPASNDDEDLIMALVTGIEAARGE